MNQLARLTAAGLPARWTAFDEVYGRSEDLRKQAPRAGLAYVAIIPCDYRLTLPSGTVIRADEALGNAGVRAPLGRNGSRVRMASRSQEGGDGMYVTPSSSQVSTLSGRADTHRKTATVVQGGGCSPAGDSVGDVATRSGDAGTPASVR
jgi:hypothetical protein